VIYLGTLPNFAALAFEGLNRSFALAKELSKLFDNPLPRQGRKSPNQFWSLEVFEFL